MWWGHGRSSWRKWVRRCGFKGNSLALIPSSYFSTFPGHHEVSDCLLPCPCCHDILSHLKLRFTEWANHWLRYLKLWPGINSCACRRGGCWGLWYGCATAQVWRSEENLWELILSLPHVGSKDQTQVTGVESVIWLVLFLLWKLLLLDICHNVHKVNL